MARKPDTYITGPPPTFKRRTRKIIFFILALLVAYTAYTYYEIASQATVDETRATDAIVVFGAAEYAGRPSPVLRARLDHALALYRQGLAPYLVTTGGNGDDPNYSEGGVGRAYLMSN